MKKIKTFGEKIKIQKCAQHSTTTTMESHYITDSVIVSPYLQNIDMLKGYIWGFICQYGHYDLLDVMDTEYLVAQNWDWDSFFGGSWNFDLSYDDIPVVIQDSHYFMNGDGFIFSTSNPQQALIGLHLSRNVLPNVDVDCLINWFPVDIDDFQPVR